MGIFSKVAKVAFQAIKESRQSQANASGSFDYLIQGLSPEVDLSGRVIARLGGGIDIQLEATHYTAEGKALAYLVGRRNEDFESRTVRLRMVLREAKGESQLALETPNGDLAAFFKKDSLPLATDIFTQLSQAVLQADANLTGPLAVDVKAIVEGTWSEDEDEDGKPIWVSQVDSLIIQIKLPIEVTIKPIGDKGD